MTTNLLSVGHDNIPIGINKAPNPNVSNEVLRALCYVDLTQYPLIKNIIPHQDFLEN